MPYGVVYLDGVLVELSVQFVSGVGLVNDANSTPALPLLLTDSVCCELLIGKVFLSVGFRAQCTRIAKIDINKRTGNITAAAVNPAVIESGSDSKVGVGVGIAVSVEGKLDVL